MAASRNVPVVHFPDGSSRLDCASRCGESEPCIKCKYGADVRYRTRNLQCCCYTGTTLVQKTTQDSLARLEGSPGRRETSQGGSRGRAGTRYSVSIEYTTGANFLFRRYPVEIKAGSGIL